MTAVAKWQPGHLYLPGDLCVPRSGTQTNQTITNPGFESGDSGWTKTNTTIVSEAGSYSGSWHAKMVYASGSTGGVQMASALTIAPGQSVTATCMLNPSGASDQVGGQVRLSWLDASNNLLSQSTGNQVDVTNGSGWGQSTVTATAPASAAKFKVSGEAFIVQATGVVLFDAFTLSVVGGNSGAGLIFEATQTDPGTSAGTEPVWPTTTGVPVTDGTVTWEGVGNAFVTWTAAPTMESGATEPTWPTTPGEFVSDGTISWECISRRIEDENCPNTKVVAIIASKVFAVDKDIVRFCATANPLDWTSEQDAGYLPTGLQQANANDMAVLNQYRGNLVAFNPSSFQNWQADPDPAAMAILDQMDGIGSSWQHAAQPVANELLYLSQRGVRSVGIAAGAENLAAGDVGEPIDVLVLDSLRVASANSTKVISTYYPGAGQYWLAFSDYPPPGLSITGVMPDGYIGDAVSTQYVASGGVLPYASYGNASGALPTGVSIASGTGLATGTFNAAGTFDFEPSVTDADGTVATVAEQVVVGVFTIAGDVTDGTVGDSKTGSYTNTHGVEPITYAVTSGTFPAGLTLATDGSYSGTYTTDGSYSWVVTGTDSEGNTALCPDVASVGPLIYWNPNDRYDSGTYEAVVSTDTKDLSDNNPDGTTHGVDCRSAITHTVDSEATGYYYAEVEGLSFYTTNDTTLAQAGILASTRTLSGSGNYSASGTTQQHSLRHIGPGPSETEAWGITWGGASSTSITPFAEGSVLGILLRLSDGMVWFRIDGTWIDWSGYECSPTNFPTNEPFGSKLQPGAYSIWGRVNAPGGGVTPAATLRLRILESEMTMTGLPDGTKAWSEA